MKTKDTCITYVFVAKILTFYIFTFIFNIFLHDYKITLNFMYYMFLTKIILVFFLDLYLKIIRLLRQFFNLQKFLKFVTSKLNKAIQRISAMADEEI